MLGVRGLGVSLLHGYTPNRLPDNRPDDVPLPPMKRASPLQRTKLLDALRKRFDQFATGRTDIAWSEVQARLESRPEKLRSLHEMERSGGEPSVIGRDHDTGEIIICDCSPETPSGRTSICYDRAARESRTTNAPRSSAVEMAEAMGIELLTEEQYRQLQTLGEFDTRTSSWLRTPPEIRQRGGALFGDRRYGRVFIYHNGAQSYFASRGFRGILRI